MAALLWTGEIGKACFRWHGGHAEDVEIVGDH
jgi:hypothetical protein